MEITEVRIRIVEGQGKLKAYASITLDGEFVIHDLKIIEGERGLFVAMPSRRSRSGEFKDIAHPIQTKTREWIQEKVLHQYNQYDNIPDV